MAIVNALECIDLTFCERQLLRYFLGVGQDRPPAAQELTTQWGGRSPTKLFWFCCMVVWSITDRDALTHVHPDFYTCTTQNASKRS